MFLFMSLLFSADEIPERINQLVAFGISRDEAAHVYGFEVQREVLEEHARAVREQVVALERLSKTNRELAQSNNIQSLIALGICTAYSVVTYNTGKTKLKEEGKENPSVYESLCAGFKIQGKKAAELLKAYNAYTSQIEKKHKGLPPELFRLAKPAGF